MIKKQIQKRITKYLLGILISLILVPLFLLALPFKQNILAAEGDLGCTINTSSNNTSRPIESMVMELNDAPGPRIANSGVKGTFAIDFKAGSEYRLAGCESLVTVTAGIYANFTVVVPGTGNLRSISNAEIRTTNLNFSYPSGRLKLSGEFTIPDLAPALQPDIASDIKARWLPEDPYESFVNIRITEAGKSSLFGATDPSQSELNLFGCVEKSLVCQKHNGGATTTVDPTSGNADDIKLNDVKFKLATSLQGDSLRYSPASRKDAPLHNFVRLYIDSSGNIKGFEMQSNIFLSSPTDKTLNINNNGKTSQLYLTTDTNGTIVKKLAKFVGSGVTDPKQSFKTSTDSGCIAGETSTHLIPFTGNVTRAFNFCNPVSFKTSNSVALRAGGDGFNFTLPMDNGALRKLKTLNFVTCTDEKAGTGCDEAINIVDVGAVLGLDESVLGEITAGQLFGKALLGFLTAGTYNLVDGYGMIKQQWTFLNGLPITGVPQSKFYIQIYKSEAAWNKNIDAPVPASVPEPKAIETSVGTKDVNAAQSLYTFITRVISDIVVWLQSLIYRVFAYIIVPVLNALLRVRPYQDIFVNIIYPGWLILRNLANIFFIISLLVVGLRILFQQSAAGAARGFIMRLIIMALLVNFSLVIGQGIVGIADTVQSQFLPANTKIIEALGSKLMVEPLKSFRQEITEKEEVFTPENSQAALSDTVKPIVLLLLSIAAFFSFVAVAAFLTVRLVMLWVLYMLSPFAYVGYVMDETKKYASQWWSEFMKQAFLTPILVFFLNIAALMATVFSTGDRNSNSLFKLSDGSLTGDVVIGSLTVITHFIVLFFIFAGMKFAGSFGGIGAKAIVKYAQAGFDAVTKRPAKWAAGAAGGLAKDAAKTQWDRRFKGGMLDPFAHREAFKKSVDDKTKAKMEARLAGKVGKLTPEGLYKDPMKALKYIGSGGSFAGAKMESEKNSLREEASIMTEKEREEFVNNRTTYENDRDKAERKQKALLENRVSTEQAEEDILKQWSDKKDNLTEESRSLRAEADDLEHKGENERALQKRNDADLVDQDIAKLNLAAKEIQDRVDAAKADGSNKITLDDLDDDVKAQVELVFDAEESKKKLKEEIEDLNDKLGAVGRDDELRAKYGYSDYMKADKRADLLTRADALEEQINNRAMPVALAATNARLAREKEHEKNIAHLEGEELREAFRKAIAENNTDLATAIGKKVAQEGDMDTLMKEYGFKNNSVEFTKFIDQKLSKLSPIVRAQVGSEWSNIAKKNGHLAISDAYKVKNGQIVTRSLEEQMRKVNSSAVKKSPDDVLKKGPNGLTYQTAAGQFINQGDVKNLNTFKGERMKNLNKMSYATAQFLTKTQNFNSLDSRVQDKIRSIAEGKQR